MDFGFEWLLKVKICIPCQKNMSHYEWIFLWWSSMQCWLKIQDGHQHRSNGTLLHINYFSCKTQTMHEWLLNWSCGTFCLYCLKGVSLVELELLTLPWHMSSTLVFSGIHVPPSLIFCEVFCRSLFVLFTVSFSVVCPSSIYKFWLPLWYLQTLLTKNTTI